MSSTASNYNITRLVLGIVLSAVAFLLSLATIDFNLWTTVDGACSALIVLLYGIMMFASSYVEEEQHFWYWTTTAWLTYLSIHSAQHSTRTQNRIWLSNLQMYISPALAGLGATVLHRVSRRWNQTGQKHAGAPDIVHDILFSYPTLLWLLIGGTYGLLTVRMIKAFTRGLDQRQAAGVSLVARALCLTAFVFKAAFTARDAPELLRSLGDSLIEILEKVPLVESARIVFAGVVGGLLWVLARKREGLGEDFSALASLFLVTQTRAQNIPLLLVFHVQSWFISEIFLTPTQATLTTLLLAQTSFFALGNSNAISSIDLSKAYNGVSGYNVLAVGILVFLSNWVGPVFWAIDGILKLSGVQKSSNARGEQRRSQKSDAVKKEPDSHDERSLFSAHISLLSLFTAASLLAVMVACTVLRTHLFIWTVFSPKYLYAMAWSLAYHYGISLGLGGFLWARLKV